MSTPATGLSVLLPVYNEADKIRACLESVKWADEILVVDSFSSDDTVAIAREYGARILQHEYVNSAKQKNWAIPQCSYEWVLQIDADERLEPELQCEIRQILAGPPPADVAGYKSPFRHHMFGRWVRRSGLYPEYHLRLFRRDSDPFEDREVDAHVQVRGRVLTTRGHFLHFGMEDISRRLNSLDRYTRYEADERAKRGRRFSWFDAVGRPIAAFCYYFFWLQGFRDGFRGMMLAMIKAEFVFWTYAKLWEKEWRHGCHR